MRRRAAAAAAAAATTPAAAPEATGEGETAVVVSQRPPGPSKPVAAMLLPSHRIPDDILHNAALAEAMAVLPPNYNFEIHKSLWQIRQLGAKRVALQFPEGLLMFSLVIADLLEHFGHVETLVMGDVTYGACCVDDYTARALDCDFLIHYGHSCLVPVTETTIKTLYVFVDIAIDVTHFVRMIEANFDPADRLVVVGTVQFVGSLQAIRPQLGALGRDIAIPQARPLSPGEILGCTAPKVAADRDAVVYLGDGRFHLEAIMIANPHVRAYRYDPYEKALTREHYHHTEMYALRKHAVAQAQRAAHIGLIMGTLGRQGSPRVVQYLVDALRAAGKQVTLVLLSEIFPDKLARFRGIDAWIQTSCPRLSIDWGYAFPTPLLSPYEAAVVLGEAPAWQEPGSYPMDFYARDSLGPWTVNHHLGVAMKQRAAAREARGGKRAPTSVTPAEASTSSEHPLS